MERRLKDGKILETVERLQKRITDRFPGSGLSGVAAELTQVTRESVARAESIRRPNFWIRGGLVLVGLLAVGGLVWHFVTSSDTKTAFRDFMTFLDATKGVGVYLIAAAAFLVTAEIRFKRMKALRAVHELRSMAHLIDMHQLNKDPERIGSKDAPLMESGRPMTFEEVGRYLHYSTELLAIVSKIGQLYVQDFPDTGAQTAVDNCERLATGLTSKIWQKIMILDRLRVEAESSVITERDQPATVST
ncbi:MAG: hypothetical protein K8U57_09530 [Planctomycetes bacterium]|nr:hypothetical protein [Planctomycetota bacterium]